MYLNFNQKLVSYFLLKLTKNILFSWLILTLLISLFDLIDLNNKTRLKENISIDSLFLLTIQNLPLRADELLFYSILFGSVFYYLEYLYCSSYIWFIFYFYFEPNSFI